MTIAVHISDPESLLLDPLRLVAAEQPEDRFLLFCNETIETLPENFLQVIIPPKPKNKLPLFYWYRYKLPSLLKKYNASAFISDAGMLSMRSDLPQYLFFGNTDFEKINGYWSRIFLAGLLKASAIFSAEDFISEKLKKFKVPEEKIQTIYRGIKPLPAAENISAVLLKEKFTDGVDYFIYPVDEYSAAHTLTVLKAFSQLKKWQKTSMKLVLLNETHSEEIVSDFKNYKYRDEVRIILPKEKNADSLIGHAFAVIFFSVYDAVLHPFHAMMNKVPVIAAENEINKSLFAKGALYTDITATALAERMQMLYKDEQYKNSLVHEGSLVLSKYDPEQTAHLLREEINNKRVIPLKKITAE